MKLVEAEKVLEKGIEVPGYFSKMISAWDIVHADPVDAEPIKHGQWNKAEDGIVSCSECGRTVAIVFDEKAYQEVKNENHYCYHCGARMNTKEN